MAYLDNSSNYNKGRRTNQKQKLILIAAMATNRKILNCRTGDSAARRAREAVWKRIMLELNMAGPVKHISEWRKVWTDLRLGMRKKWEKAQNSQHILTEYERRVIKACGMVENSGDEDYDEESAEDINSFLAFLQEELYKEHEPIQDNSDYFKEEEEEYSNPNVNYLDDSNEFIICEPTEIIDIKEEEFNEEPPNSMEYEEPAVECISDDEAATTFVEFREPSVECISDDEEPMLANGTQSQSPADLSYEEPCIAVPRPIQLQCPEIPPIPSSPSYNKKLPRRKKLKDATLKEIKKMHRNLLRESKKQTALLRKLVRRMPQKNSYKS